MVQFCYFRLYLGTETVSCCLLQQMARMNMDENLKLWANVFKVLMHCYPCKIHQNYYIIKVRAPR